MSSKRERTARKTHSSAEYTNRVASASMVQIPEVLLDDLRLRVRNGLGRTILEHARRTSASSLDLLVGVALDLLQTSLEQNSILQVQNSSARSPFAPPMRPTHLKDLLSPVPSTLEERLELGFSRSGK